MNPVNHAKVDAATVMDAAMIAVVNAQKAAHLKVYRQKTVLSIPKQHPCCHQKASRWQAQMANKLKSSASRANAEAVTVTVVIAANAGKAGNALNAPMVVSSHSRVMQQLPAWTQHPPQCKRSGHGQSKKQQHLLRWLQHLLQRHVHLRRQPRLRLNRSQRFSLMPCPCKT